MMFWTFSILKTVRRLSVYRSRAFQEIGGLKKFGWISLPAVPRRLGGISDIPPKTQLKLYLAGASYPYVSSICISGAS